MVQSRGVKDCWFMGLAFLIYIVAGLRADSLLLSGEFDGGFIRSRVVRVLYGMI